MRPAILPERDDVAPSLRWSLTNVKVGQDEHAHR